ncbi:MAG TPA: ferritin-like domain-containing protein [Acidimicrobiales bacterium]|nr:ferritin-like domain-containing protein [Acidimicrobiales bacterium]
MNINRDHLRREARETQVAHEGAMGGMRDLVNRILDPSSKASDIEKQDILLSGLNRRRFLQIGGVGVLSAAVLAACGKNDSKSAASATTAAKGKGTMSDITILRTASSLEHVAIDVYQKAIDNAGALGISATVADVAKLFQAQHKDHAGLFEGATKEAGGTPFTTANPAVMQSLAARIAALKTEGDVVMLARDLENVAAATYQSTVGAFDNLAYNAAAMSVGGVEARHAAVLNGVLKADQFPTKAFHTTQGAVAVGTGL